jgi:hypothetical protein
VTIIIIHSIYVLFVCLFVCLLVGWLGIASTETRTIVAFRSKFWKFCLIRTGFFGESVFRLFRLKRIVFSVQSVNKCRKCTTSYIFIFSIGRAIVFVMPCFVDLLLTKALGYCV